jgi:RNA polymerase sigma-70 factor (ECF subfamily)
MLAEGATFDMPPYPNWYAGREAVGAFLRAFPFAEANRWRVLPTRANGQLAFGLYVYREDVRAFVARELSVLTLLGTQIGGITVFREPEALARFGLPAQIGQ